MSHPFRDHDRELVATEDRKDALAEAAQAFFDHVEEHCGHANPCPEGQELRSVMEIAEERYYHERG